VIIPNGVDVGFFAGADELPGYPRAGGTIGFIGRYDEPRKGMGVLLDAVRLMLPAFPDLELLVAGAGDPDELLETAGPELGPHLRLLGRVSDEDKARMLASVDIYCAPNTGGESFGMILTEAMSAHTAVVASDLDAFRRVLDGGSAGWLVKVGDPEALRAALTHALKHPAARAAKTRRAAVVVQPFDWGTVTDRILQVYETVVASDPRAVVAAD
jgi:phosphatidylinositol alpha-mannosyltransferase